MKRNRMMRIASFLLIAVLATTCAISGTFAKYTSDFEATSSATVAKWNVQFKDGEGTAVLPEASFNLFETILDENGTSAETDVKTGLIAPGTSGFFKVTLSYASEVNATYTVQITETSNTANIPIQYSIDNGTTWESAASFGTKTFEDVLGYSSASNTVINFQWRWAYSTGESGDAADTVIGELSSASVTTAIKIVVTQDN